MICKDPYIETLKSFGYNVIRLPKADVRPMQILARAGNDLSRLGDLTTILISNGTIALPPINQNIRAANISGQRTSDMKIGLGLSILGTIIGAIGGSKLGLDATYQQAKTASFEFPAVYEDNVEVAKLDQYLADTDVNPFSRTVAELLEADDLFVTTAIIKSTKFTVEAKKSDGAGLELSIPAIQGVVGGNVKVSGNASITTKVTYEAAIPLAFGFQAKRLVYENGGYVRFEDLASGERGMKGLGDDEEEQSGYENLSGKAAFISLKDL